MDDSLTFSGDYLPDVIIVEKQCSKCGHSKPLALFYVDARAKDGRESQCKVCRLSTTQTWRKQNPEKAAASHSKWQTTNPEKHRLNSAKFAKTEKGRKWRADYMLRRSNTEPVFRLIKNVRNRCAKAIKLNSKKDSSTTELLGCSWDQYFGHLEINFEAGMTWDNYGIVWEIDHKRPLASFDLSDPAQQRKAFHWRNTRPLFKKENRAKSAKWDGVTNA